MKITYTKPTSTVPFKDIPVGGCFIDYLGEVCMKVLLNDGDGAVCFDQKTVYCSDIFNRDVQPVEVELIVHAEER